VIQPAFARDPGLVIVSFHGVDNGRAETEPAQHLRPDNAMAG
jgi:hypothetical protein